MTRYVAFLRAINVGGRTVKKEQLVDAFSAIDLRDVSTLKQSGNVIFMSADGEEDLVNRIETVLKDRLGFEIPVFLRTMDELEQIVARDSSNVKGDGTSHLVTFFSNAPDLKIGLPATIPRSSATVVALVGREAYSETHGGGEGGLPNPFLEKTFKVKATTRNINILIEILERCRTDRSEGVDR